MWIYVHQPTTQVNCYKPADNIRWAEVTAIFASWSIRQNGATVNDYFNWLFAINEKVTQLQKFKIFKARQKRQYAIFIFQLSDVVIQWLQEENVINNPKLYVLAASD